MVISLDGIGKRFRSQWIFRHVRLELLVDQSVAILGPNGSGKSTLLQILGGLLAPTEGTIHMTDKHLGQLPEDELVSRVSFAAPYLELPEELSLNELLHHHHRFRRLGRGLELCELPKLWHLAQAADRPIKQYSSGMKQRVKLGLAICSESPILLLDEPLTNLDDESKEWYYRMISEYGEGRLVAVASNRPDEYAFCKKILNIQDFNHSGQRNHSSIESARS